VLNAVAAAGIWTSNYDGKFLPSTKALPAFARMRQANPKLLAIASHDFHRTASFYGVALEMDVPALSAEPIMHALKTGDYRIRSAFFNCEPDGHASVAGAALVRHVGGSLENMRKARSNLGRKTA
jgi:hypothetical protein